MRLRDLLFHCCLSIWFVAAVWTFSTAVIDHEIRPVSLALTVITGVVILVFLEFEYGDFS